MDGVIASSVTIPTSISVSSGATSRFLIRSKSGSIYKLIGYKESED